jgi:hypothetical protein
MGTTDRIVRILLVLVAVILFYKGFFFGTMAIVALLLGGIFLLTAIIGICPLYIPFGINTCKKSKK